MAMPNGAQTIYSVRVGKERHRSLFGDPAKLLDQYADSDIAQQIDTLIRMSEMDFFLIRKMNRDFNPSTTLLMWYLQAPDIHPYPALKAPSGRNAWLKHQVRSLIEHEHGSDAFRGINETVHLNRKDKLKVLASFVLWDFWVWQIKSHLTTYAAHTVLAAGAAFLSAVFVSVVKTGLNTVEMAEGGAFFLETRKKFDELVQKEENRRRRDFPFLPGAVPGHPMNLSEDIPTCVRQKSWKAKNLDATNFTNETKRVLGRGTVDEQWAAIVHSDQENVVTGIMAAITLRKNLARLPQISLYNRPARRLPAGASMVDSTDKAVMDDDRPAPTPPILNLAPEALRAEMARRQLARRAPDGPCNRSNPGPSGP